MEYAALDAAVNLADGHPRVQLDTRVWDGAINFQAAFRQALRSETRAEQRLIDSFEALLGERFPRRPLISYSVSSLVMVLANHFRQRGLDVAMAEPNFDNIRDLLISGGVAVETFPEEDLATRIAVFERGAAPAVLWLTSPSNPTGRTLDVDVYHDLARHCQEAGTLLVVDNCFRFFAGSIRPFAQYALLESYPDLDYVLLEDTGKTVPLVDVKVGLLLPSRRLAGALTRLNQELLLSVSPYLLNVLCDAISVLAAGALNDWLRPLVDGNRRVLVEALRPYADRLRLASWSADSPFLWYHVQAPADGERLTLAARAAGVHVLPGTRFYADRPLPGRAFVRIALTRDREVVERGAATLCQVLDGQAPNSQTSSNIP
jgi:aspartate/methionine/tyrosine aminotransferase